MNETALGVGGEAGSALLPLSSERKEGDSGLRVRDPGDIEDNEASGESVSERLTAS